MEPIDEINADLGWRETELALLRLSLQRSDATSTQHNVMARAAWGLLYAHYEGFSKFCLSVFFDRAAKLIHSCEFLPVKTKEYALTDELKRIRNLPADQFLKAIEQFSAASLASKPSFPEVDTRSNLWPNVLEELLILADIKCPSVDKHRIKLKTLVSRRNKIAHGDSEYISGIEYYRSFEDAVYEVMHELAYGVDQRLKDPPFAETNAELGAPIA